MTSYIGTIVNNEYVVTANGLPLNPRLDLRNHSPSGFSWGYMGSGPSQLALALLANEVSDEIATEAYMAFKEKVIAKLDLTKSWQLTSKDIQEELSALI